MRHVSHHGSSVRNVRRELCSLHLFLTVKKKKWHAPHLSSWMKCPASQHLLSLHVFLTAKRQKKKAKKKTSQPRFLATACIPGCKTQECLYIWFGDCQKKEILSETIPREGLWVMSHMNESCRIWMSHVAYEWVISHMNESCHTWMSHVKYEWGMSHMNESCHIWRSHVMYEWVMSHTNESCHICIYICIYVIYDAYVYIYIYIYI